MFEELGAKRSIMIHCVKATHPLYSNNWGVRFDVFSVMAGLVVEMFFMLFSVYNTA